MEKSTISMAILNSFLYVYQRVHRSLGPSSLQGFFPPCPGDARTAVYQSQLARSQQLDDLDSPFVAVWRLFFADP